MLIGYREFTDGKTRPVYLDRDNRQFVIGDDDWPLYGVWLAPQEVDELILLRN